MMKIFILGVNGMLGHKLYQALASSFDVAGTIRGSFADISRYSFFREGDIYTEVDATRISQVEEVIQKNDPEVIINCIGITKFRKEIDDKLKSVWINSLFPHQLYQICSSRGKRLIHISTDCVFSGEKGNYKESDPSDAVDIYGKTKYLGEVGGENAVTIRTSLVGRELSTTSGLVEWFLSNKGSEVNGFTNAIFNGFTTLQFSEIITDIIKKHVNLSGIYHISSEPITKYRFLTLVKEKMRLNVQINEYPDFHCDRSLNSSFFRDETGFKSPAWEQMIDALVEDAIQYQQWRE